MTAVHDVTIDYRFFELALDYLQAPDDSLIEQMADTPAVAHLLAHARAFGYDVPGGSAETLVRQLLHPAGPVDCPDSLREVLSQALPTIERKGWLADSLAYLPESARLGGTLFLTYGYDCGVAYPPNASVNLAFSWIRKHPAHAVYYCIHEVHHAGFFSLQPPPSLGQVRTCRQLLNAVEYLTQLEGMAVLAAYPRRAADDALEDWSGDYEALENGARMKELVSCYFEIHDSLKARMHEECGPEDMAVFDVMSGGDRLWYRVGCHMARTIEKEKGRAELNRLVESGPAAFFGEYLHLA